MYMHQVKVASPRFLNAIKSATSDLKVVKIIAIEASRVTMSRTQRCLEEGAIQSLSGVALPPEGDREWL